MFSQRVVFVCVVTILLMGGPTQVLSAPAWHRETLDSAGRVGAYSAIAVDSARRVHVAYLDYTNKVIKYAVKTAAGWQPPEALDSYRASGYVALVVDATNRVHLCFTTYDGTLTNSLVYATKANGSWTTERINDIGDFGWYCSLAVDRDNRVHLAYCAKQLEWWRLKYVVKTAASWGTPYQVDASQYGLGYSSLALDRAGKVHLAYLYRERAFGNPVGYVKYATNKTGSWVNEIVKEVGHLGGHTVIAAGDQIHISFYDFLHQAFQYVRKESGRWALEAIAENINKSGAVLMVLDSLENLHVVYAQTEANQLEYARRSGDGWISEVIDSGSGERTPGGDASLAVDHMDRLHVSYYDYDLEPISQKVDEDLRYASNNLPGPDIALSPRRWYFGKVALGDSSPPLEVKVANTGNAPLTVCLEPAFLGNNFRLSLAGGASPCATFPKTLASGASCTFSLTFAPFSSQLQSIFLPFRSNDPDTDLTGIYVYGNLPIAQPPEVAHIIVYIVAVAVLGATAFVIYRNW